MKIIIDGDPQPIDCKKCKSSEGYYFVSEQIRRYSSYYNEHGVLHINEHIGTKVPKPLIRCYCQKCKSLLLFKVNITQ